MRSLRPEVELVLCCARAHLDGAARRRLDTVLHGTLAWEHVPALARWQGVFPLVYHRLIGHDAARVPPHVRAEMDRLFRSGAAYNAFLAGELRRVIDSFETDGIPALPYKGPMIALDAYGDVRLRMFNDLDVLVRPSDFKRAEGVLCREGYSPGKSLRGLRKAAFLYLEREFPFARGGRLFRVDLHAGLEPRRFSPEASFDDLWGRSIRLRVKGRPTPSLSPADVLALLAAHGSKHRWEALRYVVDVADIVRRHPELDWDAVASLTRAQQSERRLRLALYLAHSLLESPLPAEVHRRVLGDAYVRAVGRQVVERMFDRDAGAAPFRQRMAYHLGMRDTIAAKLRYGTAGLVLNSWIRGRLGV